MIDQAYLPLAPSSLTFALSVIAFFPEEDENTMELMIVNDDMAIHKHLNGLEYHKCQ